MRLALIGPFTSELLTLSCREFKLGMVSFLRTYHWMMWTSEVRGNYRCTIVTVNIVSLINTHIHLKVKEKWSRYRPGVAQRVGRGIALLFHDRGTRRVNSTLRPHFTPGKYPVPILQEVGWAPGPVWTGGKSRPHRDSILNRPTRSQSLYRLSYPAHTYT
jgi:hypothetical protein